MNPAETARLVASLGGGVTPVIPGTKRAFIEGWQHAPLSPHLYDHYFGQGGHNVGLWVGNGWVDVDLDDPVAVRIGSLLLPETEWVFGRNGQPRHYIYRTPEKVKGNSVSIPEMGKLLEMRTSAHALMPPSVIEDESGVHPVLWSDRPPEGPPPLIQISDLHECYEMTAAATILAKAWTEGVRHELAGALAGALRRAEWSLDRVEALVEAVCHGAGDLMELDDRLQYVRDTYENDGNTSGWPTVSRLVGQAATNRLRDLLGVEEAPLDKWLTPAERILATEYPPPRWVIPDLIPEGLTIFAGDSKAGKSLLCMSLALATAHGGKVLDELDVEQAGVIYMALEDNDRRLKDRMVRMMQGEPFSAHGNLFLPTVWPRLDQGGLKAIADALKRLPHVKLVIVDTLAAIRGRSDPGVNIYDRDNETMIPLRELSHRTGVSIVVVTHTNQGQHRDPFFSVQSSTGLIGVADTILVMRAEPEKNVAHLYAGGRDVERGTRHLIRNDETLLWRIASPDELETTGKSDSEKAFRLFKIYELTDGGRRQITAEMVAKALGTTNDAARMALNRAVRDGELVKAGRGLYALPNSTYMEELL